MKSPSQIFGKKRVGNYNGQWTKNESVLIRDSAKV